MNNGLMVLLFIVIIIPGAFIGTHLMINYNHHPENINMFSMVNNNWRNYDYTPHHLNDKTFPLHSSNNV